MFIVVRKKTHKKKTRLPAVLKSLPRRDGARHTLRADPCKTEKQYLDRKFMKSAFHSILELSNKQQLDIQFSSAQFIWPHYILHRTERKQKKKS